MASDATVERVDEALTAQVRVCLQRLEAIINDSEQASDHQFVHGSYSDPAGTGDCPAPGGEAGEHPRVDSLATISSVLASLRDLRSQLAAVLRAGASLETAAALDGEHGSVRQQLALRAELEASQSLVWALQRELKARTEVAERWRLRAIESEKARATLEVRYQALKRTWEAAQGQAQPEGCLFPQQATASHDSHGSRRLPADSKDSGTATAYRTMHDAADTSSERHDGTQVSSLGADAVTSTEHATVERALAAAQSLDRPALLLQLRTLYREREALAAALAQAEDRLGRGAFDPERYRLWHPRKAPPQLGTVSAREGTTTMPNTTTTSTNKMKATTTSAAAAAAAADRSSKTESPAPSVDSGAGDDEATGHHMDPWKLVQRTREAARAKIQQVVESIYYLFGWRLRIAGSVYTLESLYAENADDKIQFHRNERGAFELMATDFVQRALRAEVETLLCQMDSIPAFLATVQLQLFEQSTAVTGIASG
jgi:hypothetical protein